MKHRERGIVEVLARRREALAKESKEFLAARTDRGRDELAEDSGDTLARSTKGAFDKGLTRRMFGGVKGFGGIGTCGTAQACPGNAT